MKASKELDAITLKKAAGMLKAMAHPLRIRLVEILESGPSSVSDLCIRAGEDQVSVSKALAVLKQQGILACEIKGNLRIYSIIYPNVFNLLNCIRAHGQSDGRKRGVR
ncbi:MAG: winged helix-turn-helix transcriptional regulator [Candidatus Omnitrophica bacterium]|nr:winged helix-turn-helix transcriptional regulator [Candidatus Omnitrophota bacterium]